jgi:hypothetical protein
MSLDAKLVRLGGNIGAVRADVTTASQYVDELERALASAEKVANADRYVSKKKGPDTSH